MGEMFFTSTEAAKITGCTPRQLQYWRQKEVVVPTVNTTGTGRNVYYSVADLLMLKAMEYLLSMGLSFAVARETLEALKEQEPGFFINSFNQAKVKRFMLWRRLPQEKLSLAEFDRERAQAAILSGQPVIPFWLDAVHQQLKEGLKNLGYQLALF